MAKSEKAQRDIRAGANEAFRYPSGLSGTGFIDLYKRCLVLEAKTGQSRSRKSPAF